MLDCNIFMSNGRQVDLQTRPSATSLQGLTAMTDADVPSVASVADSPPGGKPL